MSESEDNNLGAFYLDAMRKSTEAMKRGDNEQALRLLDGAIAMATRENENQWVLTLAHHAANIARFLGDSPRVKYYYQESLKFNPENPRALSGLADVAKEEGHLELAKEYAAQCYKALIEGDDFLKSERLETLLKEWPDVAQR